MDINMLEAIVEKVKNDCLIPIPENSSLLEHVNDRMVNHGIMTFFYAMLTALYEYEGDKKNDRMAS